jgi:hypothetical protein
MLETCRPAVVQRQLQELLTVADMLAGYIEHTEYEEEARNRAMSYLVNRLCEHAVAVEAALAARIGPGKGQCAGGRHR